MESVPGIACYSCPSDVFKLTWHRQTSLDGRRPGLTVAQPPRAEAQAAQPPHRFQEKGRKGKKTENNDSKQLDSAA